MMRHPLAASAAIATASSFIRFDRLQGTYLSNYSKCIQHWHAALFQKYRSSYGNDIIFHQRCLS
ncbi:hypothetical protein SCLCIDRAFT_1207882 [Scleroderma citrinum Foug A]|uniref:Uncharacterized protein n=1 Tax=Scleroderma citrinum Foug A TaxID=1036808 RepID=A0A0C3ENL7_9AGAM|nr:hypothetical protein SCLCIDRAFT_1207882 [Scleroderma citrinum Foug A]